MQLFLMKNRFLMAVRDLDGKSTSSNQDIFTPSRRISKNRIFSTDTPVASDLA
jgi:hypothetical protein